MLGSHYFVYLYMSENVSVACYSEFSFSLSTHAENCKCPVRMEMQSKHKLISLSKLLFYKFKLITRRRKKKCCITSFELSKLSKLQNILFISSVQVFVSIYKTDMHAIWALHLSRMLSMQHLLDIVKFTHYLSTAVC